MNRPPERIVGGLERIFLEMRPKLLGRARAMGAGEDAEDLLQEVWMRLGAVEGPIANPEAYLHRMVYRAALDRNRGLKRAGARDGAWHDLGEGVQPDAERNLIIRQTLAAVEDRLNALGEPAASIFRRHRLAGQTQRRIAEELGMGLSTVEKHLRRAYAAILDVERDHEV